MSVDLRMNVASEIELVAHLTQCSSDFIPSLSSRVDIAEYARKMVSHAVRFEAWDKELVGLVAAYFDVGAQSAFVTNVSILRSHRNRGIASSLLRGLSTYCTQAEIRRIVLEVDAGNGGALSLYRSLGFDVEKQDGMTMTLILNLGVQT